MQEVNGAQKKRQVMVSLDPDLIERADRIADEFFGSNRSLLITRATVALVDRKEAELAEREAKEAVAA